MPFKSLISSIKSHSSSSSSTLDSFVSQKSDNSSFPQPSPALPLSPALVPRYRKQKGVSLGSWFSLEKWISPSPFRDAADHGSSDLDIARGKNAKANLEAHWDGWMKEEDWEWIVSRGFNSVRLPIAYFHLCGALPEVLQGTDFEPYHAVYEGAWQRIEQAVRTAESYGLGVLIDLHGAAGGQNGDAHCGVSSGKISLWSSPQNLASTSLALRFLVSQFAPNPHVIGLELLNEPANNGGLQKWYEHTLSQCRELCTPDFPLYISDAWDPNWYIQFVDKRDDFVVLDHHLYRCFTDGDKALSGDDHAQKLVREFPSQFLQGSKKGNVTVGEWSGSLDNQSFRGRSGGEADAQRRVFVKAQLEIFEKYTAGSWFWTYKKESGWDAGWDARNASQAEILPSQKLRVNGAPSQEQRQSATKEASETHINYWKDNGGSPHPELLARGFESGWADSLMFLNYHSPSGPCELGFVQQWIQRRKSDLGLPGDSWEWDHGFKQGVEACKAAALG